MRRRVVIPSSRLDYAFRLHVTLCSLIESVGRREYGGENYNLFGYFYSAHSLLNNKEEKRREEKPWKRLSRNLMGKTRLYEEEE